MDTETAPGGTLIVTLTELLPTMRQLTDTDKGSDALCRSELSDHHNASLPKPQNVLLHQRSNGDLQIKIGDYGLA